MLTTHDSVAQSVSKCSPWSWNLWETSALNSSFILLCCSYAGTMLELSMVLIPCRSSLWHHKLWYVLLSLFTVLNKLHQCSPWWRNDVGAPYGTDIMLELFMVLKPSGGDGGTRMTSSLRSVSTLFCGIKIYLGSCPRSWIPVNMFKSIQE